ncbi:MAG: hypothetical protein JRI23_13540 [Deltaproteobacteria bacterium]|jgi:glycine betaine/choline ABC-type transport system substrate-binding protein|nr:hypothetical protein [Deltaproteobacteria bacterium]MBW2532751.1 hypothetical protein [Deltaproteobacteria bacterium]
MRATAWLVIALALLSSGCGDSDMVRIGKKSFAEQSILAELVRQLVLARADIRAQVVDCGDTYDCQQELGSGGVDLLVEYDGTAALFEGLDPWSEELESDLGRVFQAKGVRWLPPLGFDNAYRLAVSARKAAQLELRTIEDLSAFEGGVRVVCPQTYLRRPRDGLAALVNRHGLRLRGEPLTLREPSARLEAVLAGRADVAVVYGTDGALQNDAVTLLEDSLDFFPRYRASVLVREQALHRTEGLQQALAELSGSIDEEAMRELNHAVQLEGWRPAAVARRFLVDRDLVEREAVQKRSRLRLVVAHYESDSLEPLGLRAMRALRKVFTDRPVELAAAADPPALVAKGSAKLALVGAERFFDERGEPLAKSRALEAVAVVGSRSVHLLRVADDASGDPFGGRIGIEPKSSGAGRVAAAVLRAVGATAAVQASSDQLLGKVEAGGLDAVLVVAERGSPELVEAMKRGTLELVDLPALSREGMAYLRPTRLPAETYVGQPEPIETLSAQVVLAGPTRRHDRTALKPGPGSALLVEATPLTMEEVRLLAAATGVAELPDPMLPVAWTAPNRGDDDEATSAVVDTVINLLLIGFLLWLVVVTVRRPSSEDDEGELDLAGDGDAGSEPAES